MRQRRDPRRDRDRRRTAGKDSRPRFALATPETPVTGRRRNPRLERDARLVPGMMRRRYALSGTPVFAGRPDIQTTVETAIPARIVSDPDFMVLAIIPPGSGAKDMQATIRAGRQLCDGGNGAVCVLADEPAADYAEAGADRLIIASQDQLTPALAARLAGDLNCRHIVMAEAPDSGDFARKTAAKLGERLFAAAEHIADGRATRRAVGGASEISAVVPRILTIMPDYFMILPDQPGTAQRLEIDLPPRPLAPDRLPESRMLPADPAQVPLSEADFVLSGGNGVTDWEGFSELSRRLGAAPGGSRMVCDAGHLPRDRQIGASGTVISAQCYFALGISGAPQHLQGIGDVPHVVAVNTDLHAAMIRRADLAIIADAQEVMPALIRLLSGTGGSDA